MHNLEGLKSEIHEIQKSLIVPLQHSSRILASTAGTDRKINELMDELLCSVENACIEIRRTVERHRPIIPIGDAGKKKREISDAAGSIEVTAEGWVHIRLNTLLPHCKYKVSGYLQDTISRLLDNYGQRLPKYKNTFLAIVEHCNHTNRNAFDNDNKAWKMIPNALKGRLFDDDDQFNLSLGLFAKLSNEVSCHVYILPIEEASDFMSFLGRLPALFPVRLPTPFVEGEA